MTTTSLHHLSPTLVRLPVLLLFALALVSATVPIPAPGAAGALPVPIPEAPGAAPLSIPDLPVQPAEALAFVPNRGQTDPRVRFQTHAAGAEVFFTPAEVVLALSGNGVDTSVVRVRFDGANPSPELAPGAQLPGVVNYYLGQNRAEWHTSLPTYDSVVYRELYPGIDVRYDGPAGALKSTYTVAPHADPSVIAWRYEIGRAHV